VLLLVIDALTLRRGADNISPTRSCVNDSLGGISRLTFQMSVASLPHAKLMCAIELLGTRVAPLVRAALASGTAEALCLRTPIVLYELRKLAKG
jgi:hypothetical protein